MSLLFQNWEVDEHGEKWAPLHYEASIEKEVRAGLVQLDNGYNTSNTLILPFEHISEIQFHRWLVPTVWKQCFWYTAIYIVVIFSIRHIMEKRQRFELRTPLTLWSLFLAIFSIGGAIRMNQELFYILTEYGWEQSVCSLSFGKAPFGFWVVAFVLSKVFEYGDTLFIVLRKQPLIFLHWYHHIATLIYTWVAYSERTSTGRWFITMNYTVHAFMYSYYTCRAMKIRVPRWINIAITTMQTSQMAVGLAVNFKALAVKNRGGQCQQSYGIVAFSLAMYFSYFLLFSWFFYNAYIRAKPKSSVKSSEKTHQNGVHQQNGVHKNGLIRNGVASNGAATNGVKTNGAATNGAVTNGIKKYN